MCIRDRVMAAAFYARCDSKKNFHLLSLFTAYIFYQSQFLQTVDNDSADSIFHSHRDLRPLFIIAVKFNFLCGETGFDPVSYTHLLLT